MTKYHYVEGQGVKPMPVYKSPFASMVVEGAAYTYITESYGHLLKPVAPPSFVISGISGGAGDSGDRRRVPRSPPFVPLDLNTFVIERGTHTEGRNVGCVMEFASAIAGEPWTDHPQCVSPVIAAFLRSVNDSIDQDARQALRPYVFRALDTRTSVGDEATRSWMALDFVARTILPAYLDVVRAIGWVALARALRARPPGVCGESLAVVIDTIGESALGPWQRADGLFCRSGHHIDIPELGHWNHEATALQRDAATLYAVLNVGTCATSVPGKRSIFGIAMERDRQALALRAHDVREAAITADSVQAIAVGKALYARALELVNAMCEVGRTPVIEAKVRAVAEARGKSAWLDEGVRDETCVLAGADAGAGV